MKKILIVSFMLLSIFALASCGKDDSETTATNTFSLQGSGS